MTLGNLKYIAVLLSINWFISGPVEVHSEEKTLHDCTNIFLQPYSPVIELQSQQHAAGAPQTDSKINNVAKQPAIKGSHPIGSPTTAFQPIHTPKDSFRTQTAGPKFKSGGTTFSPGTMKAAGASAAPSFLYGYLQNSLSLEAKLEAKSNNKVKNAIPVGKQLRKKKH
jgi:hypothetical protein